MPDLPAKAGPVVHLLNPTGQARGFATAVTGGLTAMAPYAWISREHPEHTETLVDWCLREGVKRVVVWGGDGTLHRVVRALRARKAFDRLELALVPAGTCNDLARRYELSKYYWSRWEKPQPEGRLVSLSVGRVAWDGGEDVFINNAGFGRPRRSFEAKEGPWGVLKSFEPIRLSAEWDGGRLQGLYYMALACNAPYFSGGLHFEKGPSPEDGRLSLYLVPATSKVRLALRLLRGRLGFPLFDGKTTKVTASSVKIETETPVWPQADGEAPPVEGARRVEFSLLQERIKMWLPEKT